MEKIYRNKLLPTGFNSFIVLDFNLKKHYKNHQKGDYKKEKKKKTRKTKR